MGGGGGSSSSENNTTTNQTDERVAASDQAVVVQLSDGSQINMIDPEGQAFLADVLEDAENLFGTAFQSVEYAFDFAEHESNKSETLTKEILNKSQSEEQQLIDKLVKAGAIAATAYVAVKVLGKGN